MLFVFPVTLFFLGALVILILRRTISAFGYAWLISAAVSLLNWLIFIILRWTAPEPFSIAGWQPISGVESALMFTLDNASWPYAMALTTLVLGNVLTAPVRMQRATPAWTWSGILAIGGMGMLALLAGNPLTLALAWTGVDFIEMLFIISSVSDKNISLRAVVSFGARVSGTFILIWAMALSRLRGLDLSFASVSPEIGLYLLLASGLRLGVIPFYVTYANDLPVRRGFGTLLRLVAPASSLVMLGRLPNLVMPSQWALALSAFTALAALYGAIMWLTAENELAGRPYWLIALAGMAVASVARVQSAASIPWGVTMLLSGGMLFLYSVRWGRSWWLALSGFIAMTGLPFTPCASGWSGLIVSPINILDIIFLLAHAILLIGYLRHALRPGDSADGLERWIKVIYPIGLGLMAAVQWLIAFGPDLLPKSNLWASIISTCISIGITVWLYRRRSQSDQGAYPTWIIYLSRRVGVPLADFFRMDWLYRLFYLPYRLLQNISGTLSLVIEGDGGLLWSLLLLILLISLIRSGVLQ